MANSKANFRLETLLDRVGLGQIAIAAVLLTFVPAAGYCLMSNYGDFGFIGTGEDHVTDFFNALYFSIATEATLGYGDIAPHGGARILASLQALSGVVIAGLAVAKVTSLNIRYSHQAVGDWIEPCKTDKGKLMISFTRIYETEQAIRYDGANFSPDGEPLGTFVGEMIDQSGMSVTFSYSNRDSIVEHFTEGTTHHLFTADAETDVWNRFQATCHDTGMEFTVQYEGFRASKDEIEVIRGTDFDARRDLIRRYVRCIEGAKCDAAG